MFHKYLTNWKSLYYARLSQAEPDWVASSSIYFQGLSNLMQTSILSLQDPAFVLFMQDLNNYEKVLKKRPTEIRIFSIKNQLKDKTFDLWLCNYVTLMDPYFLRLKIEWMQMKKLHIVWQSILSGIGVGRCMHLQYLCFDDGKLNERKVAEFSQLCQVN